MRLPCDLYPVATPWRKRYAYLQDIQQQLAALDQKLKSQVLSPQELWKRAFYTVELDGSKVAFPLLQEVLNVQPDHPDANFLIGEMLLAEIDTQGIDYIEKEINNSMDFVIHGNQLIIDFLHQQGKDHRVNAS